ncbi:hypothetical protein ARMGADRAFT_1067893 [Armillaria gallica]|uniref:Uncharacterized protein n=1 Tax=Armillaria gallica TaxID=47427 RepID=A0A2H3CV95_ARMGA|nr:hypothetical protein ARMGADRAFT_1067893 [Armillaria gallica]
MEYSRMEDLRHDGILAHGWESVSETENPQDEMVTMRREFGCAGFGSQNVEASSDEKRRNLTADLVFCWAFDTALKWRCRTKGIRMDTCQPFAGVHLHAIVAQWYSPLLTPVIAMHRPDEKGGWRNTVLLVKRVPTEPRRVSLKTLWVTRRKRVSLEDNTVQYCVVVTCGGEEDIGGRRGDKNGQDSSGPGGGGDTDDFGNDDTWHGGLTAGGRGRRDAQRPKFLYTGDTRDASLGSVSQLRSKKCFRTFPTHALPASTFGRGHGAVSVEKDVGFDLGGIYSAQKMNTLPYRLNPAEIVSSVFKDPIHFEYERKASSRVLREIGSRIMVFWVQNLERERGKQR